MAIDPNLKAPYVASWNFSVQHAFNNNLSLDLGYVGNLGERLLQFRDINQIDPTTGARPYANKFPFLNFINYASNRAHSNYNSLQATLTKRLSHGLSFLAGYTYGHGLDKGSINRGANLPQDDVRHRLTVTATYAIPGKKGFGQLLEGWNVHSPRTFQKLQIAAGRMAPI